MRTLLSALTIVGSLVATAGATTLEDIQHHGRELTTIASALHEGKGPEATDRLAALDTRLREREASLVAADSIVARKLAQVRLLAGVLELAHQRSDIATLEHFSAVQRSQGSRLRVVDHRSAGATCDAPLDLATETPLVSDLDEAGRTGDGIWLRWQAPAAGHFGINTYGSEIDSNLDVYAECGDVAGKPVARNDDAMGLSSAVTVEVAHAGQVFLIKARNLGKPGTMIVTAKAGEAIRGRLTEESSGLPLPNINVFAFHQGGGVAGTTSSDTSGDYTMLVYVGDSGQPLQVRTLHQQYSGGSARYVDEAWPDRPCAESSFYTTSCPGAQPITVAANGEVADIDFALGTGFELTGTISDARSGSAIAHAEVRVVKDRDVIRALTTDELGNYRASGLQTGPVRLYAGASTHQPEFYNDKPCTSYFDCLDDGTGDPISLSAPSTTVDMALTPWSYLDVDLTLDGQIDSSGGASFIVSKTSGEEMPTSVDTSGLGRFRVGPLPAGSYRLHAAYPNLSFRQVYAGINCSDNCAAELSQATPIQIAEGGDQVRLAMNLRRLPKLTGKVIDAQTGAGIAGARVHVLAPGDNLSGSRQSSGTTNGSGEYVVRNVPRGAYYIVAAANEYTNLLYPDIPCEHPSPLSNCPIGTPVSFSLAGGDRQIDLALQRGRSISGTMLASGANLPGGTFLSASTVALMNASLQRASAVVTIDAATGRYRITDFAAGSYFIGAQVNGYFAQLFPGVDCPDSWSGFGNCAIKNAEVLNAGTADLVADFDLRPFGSRIVQVRDQATNAPLAGIAVDLWNLSGQSLGGSRTNAQGRAMITISGAAQDLRISTDNEQGYLNEVYRDRMCAEGTSTYRGNCPLNGAETIRLPDFTANPAVIAFRLSTLATAATVFVSGFE